MELTRKNNKKIRVSVGSKAFEVIGMNYEEHYSFRKLALAL